MTAPFGFSETRNPTWYDEARGLWCPGATATTTAPPTTTTTSASRGAAGEPGAPDLVDPSQLVEVRATRRGSRTVTFSVRVRGNRPIEIPSSLSRRGYRLSIFGDGVQMLVIPLSR